MKELTIEQKAKAYDEAIKRIENIKTGKCETTFLFTEGLFEHIFPELKVSKDERIRKVLVDYFKRYKGQEERGGSTMFCGIPTDDILTWFEKQYKKELANFDKAEKEKSDFVGGGFIKCFRNFLDFKKFENYWLEYIGDDNYNVRSDNLLGKTYHITPYQLYTIFRKQTGFKKQGESMETNPDEIIEECYQDNADHIIDIVTEQEKPSEWSGEDEKIMSAIMEEGELKPSERHWLKSLKERVQSKTRKKNIEQNLAKKYGITGIGSKHVEGKLGEMMKKKIETENVDNANKVEPKFKVGDIVQYITDSTDRRKIEEVDTLCNMYHTDSSPIMFEIEDEWKVVVNAEDVEQNPTDEGIKAELNLKVGDWVVRKDGETFRNGSRFVQITKIEGSMCYLDTGTWLYDSEIRAWSIYDAQDGDLIYVSTEEKSIHAIFDTFDNGIIYFHCYLCGDFTQGGYMPMGDVELVNPLPKTHHQRFFQKMKEAEYEFDFEKKELKAL